MKLKWFETGTIVLTVIGYALMFAGFAVAKGLVPETWLSVNSVSVNLAACAFFLLTCEIWACCTWNVMFKTNGEKVERTKFMWMRTVAVALVLFMLVSCQQPLLWYKLTGNAEAFAIFIKVVVPVLTMFVVLTAALYVTRQRRQMVYV